MTRTPFFDALADDSQVVVLRAWQVKELGIHAVFFAQLLYVARRDQTDTIVRGDHEWEDETGLGRSQVLRAKNKLAEKGWIEVEVRKVRGTPTSHITIVAEAIDAHLRAVHCAESDTPASRDSAQTSTSQMGSREGERVDRAVGADPKAEEDLDFKLFYEEVYPKRVGRGAARKAYSAARKKADADKILAGAQRYAAAMKDKEPRFICHPATWLNQERWDDDPAALTAGSGSGGSKAGAGHRRPIDTDRSGESGEVEF